MYVRTDPFFNKTLFQPFNLSSACIKTPRSTEGANLLGEGEGQLIQTLSLEGDLASKIIFIISPGADPGEVKWVNFHPPPPLILSPLLSFFFFLIPQSCSCKSN